MGRIIRMLGCVAVMSISHARADMRISKDGGGLVLTYIDRFEAARASRERVIIDGPCLSACTIAIAILPRRQLCATPNAVLGFHAAWRRAAAGARVTSPEATQAMYAWYPRQVRKWIDHHGGLSGRMIFLQGRELADFVPACSAVVNTAATNHVKRRQLHLPHDKWTRARVDMKSTEIMRNAPTSPWPGRLGRTLTALQFRTTSPENRRRGQARVGHSSRR